MSASLAILDVGHGNCSIINDNNLIGIIDAGKGPHASFYLESKGITEIDLIIISHADDDHLAGIIGLLSSEKINVKSVLLNADPTKDTSIWRDVRALLSSQHNQGKIFVSAALSSGVIDKWKGQELVLDALSPSVFNVLSGVGGKDENGRVITSNSGSVVIRVSHSSGNKALLAADMEEKTLEEILSRNQEMNASILIFPHHGGNSGSSANDEFADRLLSAVDPSIVLFSNGRDKHGNPKPEIMSSVCARKTPYIACTQLSKNCNSTTVKRDLDSSICSYSAGADSGRSCAGTIEIDLATGKQNSSRMSAHISFIQSLEKPMCMVMNSVQPSTTSQHSAVESAAAPCQVYAEALQELQYLVPEDETKSPMDAMPQDFKN